MEDSKIIKSKKDRDFTTIYNIVLQNEKLSWAAKGLYSYLESLPADWVFYKNEVMKHGSNGRAAFETAWNELEKFGYLSGANMIRSGGQFRGRDYIFSALTDLDKQRILKNSPMREISTPMREIDNGTDADFQHLQKTNNTTKTNIQTAGAPFTDFWNKYDKKVGRPKAEILWNKLPPAAREKIMIHLDLYTQIEKRFRKDPERYLKNKTYEDEVILKPADQKPWEAPRVIASESVFENLERFNERR